MGIKLPAQLMKITDKNTVTFIVFLKVRLSVVWPYSPGSTERRLNGVEQQPLADWFAQHRHRTSFHRPLLFDVIGVSCDKHNRNPLVDLRQAMLQFQAVHFWHADVENQARDFLDITGAEEFARRGEGLGWKTKRMNQVSRGLRHRGVIIYYTNQRHRR